MKTVPIQSKILRFVIIVGFVLGTVVLSGKMTVTGFTENKEQAAAEITNEKQ